MKSRNYITLITSLFLLLATVSYAQKGQDSLITLKVKELRAFEECCFREAALEKDTTNLQVDINDYKNQIYLYKAQTKDNDLILKDQSYQLTALKKEIDKTNKALAKEQRQKNLYKKLTLILSPLTIFGAGVITYELLKK